MSAHTHTHTHTGFLCSSGHCNAFRCCKVILLDFPETLQQFFIDSLIGLNGSMVLMYLCVFDEFVLIGVCIRSGLSVSMPRERVQWWFWNECLTYMYFSVCVSGAAQPLLNLH